MLISDSESNNALEGRQCVYFLQLPGSQSYRQQRINEVLVTILLLKSSSAVKSKDNALKIQHSLSLSAPSSRAHNNRQNNFNASFRPGLGDIQVQHICCLYVSRSWDWSGLDDKQTYYYTNKYVGSWSTNFSDKLQSSLELTTVSNQILQYCNSYYADPLYMKQTN